MDEKKVILHPSFHGFSKRCEQNWAVTDITPWLVNDEFGQPYLKYLSMVFSLLLSRELSEMNLRDVLSKSKCERVLSASLFNSTLNPLPHPLINSHTYILKKSKYMRNNILTGCYYVTLWLCSLFFKSCIHLHKYLMRHQSMLFYIRNPRQTQKTEIRPSPPTQHDDFKGYELFLLFSWQQHARAILSF